MNLLLTLLIILVVLFVVGIAAHFIIRYFNMPQEAYWVVGAFLLLALLIAVAYLFAGGGGVAARAP